MVAATSSVARDRGGNEGEVLSAEFWVLSYRNSGPLKFTDRRSDNSALRTQNSKLQRF